MSQKIVTSDYVKPAESSLMWVFITPPGKPSLQEGKNRFTASLYTEKDSEGCKALIAAIDAFWAENKPKKTANAKSLGYREVMQKNEDGEDEPLDPPMMSFNFWTGTTFQDGNMRKIEIRNAANNKVSLGNKKIGNGSKGAISGFMDIYDQGPANRGVTLYLNAIQLTKFVPYEDDPGFGQSEAEEEGAFMGVDEDLPEVEGDAPTEGSGRPRL